MRLKVGVLPFGGWSRLFAAAALAWWTVAINGEQAGNPQGARPTLIKKAHDNEPVRGLAFSSDGRYLITMGNGTGKRWQQTLPGGQGVVEGSRIVEVKIWETPREAVRWSEEAWAHAVSLPIYPSLGADEVERVAAAAVEAAGR